MSIWDVDLVVHGPITIKREINLLAQKGFDLNNPFYSDIRIRNTSLGLRATISARADTETLAHEAAVVFFGKMLDSLTLTVNVPMYLSLNRRISDRLAVRQNDVRRRIEDAEFREAFYTSSTLATNSPAYLRSLGWYRKGMYSEDPLDQYLAFWNSIEIVAAKYCCNIPGLNRSKNTGSKYQIWECFKAIWGECDDWPLIPTKTSWIDEGHQSRIDIAHGTREITIEWIKELVDSIGEIRQVAFRFLSDFPNSVLDPRQSAS